MITVRQMRADEAQEASAVMCACYEEASLLYGYNDAQRQHLVGKRAAAATVAGELSDWTYLVACEGDGIVGVAAVHGSELTRLFVKPGLQGRGIGSKLLLAAEETVRENGCKEITVRVLFSDAIGFYEKHGMTEFKTELKDQGPFKGHEVKLLRKEL